MSHIDDRVIDLARTALSLEFGGEHFYRHAAAMTRNPSGKSMFLRLAEEEDAHRDDTHQLFGALVGEDEWKRLVAEEAEFAHPSKVVTELEAAVALRGHALVADDAQALRLAMELERRAIKMFEELATHTSDPAMVELIGKMAEEERMQYDFFQAQLDAVLNVGLWLDEPEFRMDGKF
jgi:rubrerythrin